MATIASEKAASEKGPLTAAKTPRATIKAADHYDAVVIGGGLSGLLTARALDRAGKRVALVEGLEALGGNCRPTENALCGQLDHGLKHFPDAPDASALLDWCSALLEFDLAPVLIDAPSVTFDGGRFQPFVGFGETSVLAADDIASLATPQYWRPNTSPKDWIGALTRNFGGAVFTQSYVTRILVEDQRAVEVVLNGAKRISGTEVLFCASPGELLGLVATDGTTATGAPARLRQRLSKGDVLTSVHLDLIHLGQVTDSEAIHVLKGANEEPCAGLFHPPQEASDGRVVQRSQWITFITSEETEDSELTAARLKYVKRQIKRAYETSLDGLLHERILICPQSHGSAIGFLGEDRLWPKTKNLRAVSSFFSAQRGLFGAIAECRRAVALLQDKQTDGDGPVAEVVDEAVTRSEAPEASL